MDWIRTLAKGGLPGNPFGVLAIGVGVAIFIPFVIGVIAGLADLRARWAMKCGARVFDKGRELVEEARAEIVEKRSRMTSVSLMMFVGGGFIS